MDNGEDYVRNKIGVESTGKPFNAIMDFAQGQELKDHINPMVNIGAIIIFNSSNQSTSNSCKRNK